MPLHSSIEQSVRDSFADVSSAVKNTIMPPPGVSRLRGFLNFFAVGVIAVVVLFPLLRKVPVLKKAIPRG